MSVPHRRAFKIDASELSQLQSSIKQKSSSEKDDVLDKSIKASQKGQQSNFIKAHPTNSNKGFRSKPFIKEKNFQRMSMPVTSISSMQLQSAVASHQDNHMMTVHTTDEIEMIPQSTPQIAKTITIAEISSDSPRKKSEIEYDNYCKKAMQEDFPDIEALRVIHLAGNFSSLKQQGKEAN